MFPATSIHYDKGSIFLFDGKAVVLDTERLESIVPGCSRTEREELGGALCSVLSGDVETEGEYGTFSDLFSSRGFPMERATGDYYDLKEYVYPCHQVCEALVFMSVLNIVL